MHFIITAFFLRFGLWNLRYADKFGRSLSIFSSDGAKMPQLWGHVHVFGAVATGFFRGLRHSSTAFFPLACPIFPLRAVLLYLCFHWEKSGGQIGKSVIILYYNTTSNLVFLGEFSVITRKRLHFI